jgi:xanthine dehydrogenase iron-sulfur cluster and FAD-binding subunit A
LCRCTGYQAVVDAIEAASRRHPQHGQTDQNMMATEMVDTGEEET